MPAAYSIGEFARIVGLSVKTLRFYDEVGLLKPKEVSLSGYRYYDASQLPAVRLIQRLKALEFMLEEIREVLEGRADLRGALERQQALLASRAASYADAASRAAAWLSALAGCREEAEGPMRQYEVRVEEVRPVTAMVVRKVGAVREAGPRVAAVMAYLAQQGRRPDGPPVAVYFDEEFDPERTDFAAGWPVGQSLPGGDSPTGPVEPLTLPGGRVAWVKHVGPYDELGDAYRALLDHIKASGLRVTGPPR